MYSIQYMVRIIYKYTRYIYNNNYYNNRLLANIPSKVKR